GKSKDDPISKWTTDVLSDGFQGVGKLNPKDRKHLRRMTVGGGALAATGNTRFVVATASFAAHVRSGGDLFGLAAAGNYVRTAAQGESPRSTVENLQGRARYDHFFAVDWAAFLANQARHDRF